MRPVQLETLALQAVDRVLRRERSEDSRFEFKRVLPTGNTAARRIAAHANAARGEPVVWIVGIDEKTGEFVRDQTDLASWWQIVSAQFESVVPDLSDIRVQVDESHSVLALSFESGRAPYVVKNERFNEQAGAVEWEVPWRDGTRTRTARRSDLLRILAPASRVPETELLSSSAEITGQTEADAAYLRVRLNFYAMPLAADAVVIPFHRCACRVKGGPADSELALSVQHVQPETLQNTDTLGAGYQVARNPRITFTKSDVTLFAPGILELVAGATIQPGHAIWAADALTAVAELHVLGASGVGRLESNMKLRSRGKKDSLRLWGAEP